MFTEPFESEELIIFVHGFGTNKNEGADLFVHISQKLKIKFSIIRFDFSGCGQSQGKQEDACQTKMAEDLRVVYNFCQRWFNKTHIIAHSLGCFVVNTLGPIGFDKIIFTNPPDFDGEKFISDLQKRIIEKGAKVNENGITTYPRTTGENQMIGKNFWRDLWKNNQLEKTKNLAKKSQIFIFQSTEDDVIKDRDESIISELEKAGIVWKKISGDHNFTRSTDRNYLIHQIKNIFGY